MEEGNERLIVVDEFDLLEQRLIRLIEVLRDLGDKRVKAENKELVRKIRLVKAKIKKILKEVYSIEGKVDIDA